jgi:hypothetical protein
MDGLQTHTTVITSGAKSPQMVLTVLRDNGDDSIWVKQYDVNNTDSIPLGVDQHIRFESRDYRTPEGMKVIAISRETGIIHVLQKSYDVNNEFFVKLEKGDYQLRVQATWYELGTHFYLFDIRVT